MFKLTAYLVIVTFMAALAAVLIGAWILARIVWGKDNAISNACSKALKGLKNKAVKSEKKAAPAEAAA